MRSGPGVDLGFSGEQSTSPSMMMRPEVIS